MRKLLLTTLSIAALGVLVAPAMAETLIIEAPHSYEGVAAVKAAGVFVTIHNHSDEADKLVSASTPAAGVTELHTIIDEDGVKKMRAVDSFEIPANGVLNLSRGGDHIMLVNMPKPLKAGETVPLNLVFEKAGTREVSVNILEQSAAPDGADDHDEHAHH